MQRFSLLAGLFALLCWQLVNVSWSVSLLGTVIIVAIAVNRQIRSQPLMVLTFHSANGWQLSRGGAKAETVELLPPMLVTPKLTALRFAAKSEKSAVRERVNVCLCVDSVPAELHRKLRVVLNTEQYRLNRNRGSGVQ